MMDSSLSAELSRTQKLLVDESQEYPDEEAEASATTGSAARSDGPKTLLDMKEDSLLYKAEKIISGRRVLIAFYSETKHEDLLNYSHNIRIVVASVQSLDILALQDFHEDTLEFVCSRRGKRHLMSAMREHEL